MLRQEWVFHLHRSLHTICIARFTDNSCYCQVSIRLSYSLINLTDIPTPPGDTHGPGNPGLHPAGHLGLCLPVLTQWLHKLISLRNGAQFFPSCPGGSQSWKDARPQLGWGIPKAQLLATGLDSHTGLFPFVSCPYPLPLLSRFPRLPKDNLYHLGVTGGFVLPLALRVISNTFYKNTRNGLF